MAAETVTAGRATVAVVATEEEEEVMAAAAEVAAVTEVADTTVVGKVEPIQEADLARRAPDVINTALAEEPVDVADLVRDRVHAGVRRRTIGTVAVREDYRRNGGSYGQEGSI